MDHKLNLYFMGPFSWSLLDEDAPCVFNSQISLSPGIYLWTIPTSEGELVYYVGETGRDLQSRMTEHLSCQLSGMYKIYDPSLFLTGKKKLLWGGMFGRTKERSLAEFLRKLPDLGNAIVEFVHLFHFHLAALECENLLRKRVEAAIADHFYAQDGVVGEFQDDDIRYDRSFPSEDSITVKCRSSVLIRGFPDTLVVGHRVKSSPTTG